MKRKNTQTETVNAAPEKKKSRASKVVSVISVIVFIIALALLIVSIIFQRNPRATLFGYRLYTVETPSMEPDIPRNSLIVVKRIDPNELEVGDVISFFSSDPSIEGKINTHAIYAIDREDGKLIFTTKGVNNPIPDEAKVSPDDIVGIVKSHSASLGKVYKALSNRAVLFIVTIVPLAVIVIVYFVELVINIHKPYPEDGDGKKENPTDRSDKNGEE